MLIKVINARYVGGHIMEVSFNDGVIKKVDLKDCFRGPVFEELKEVENFKNFSLNRWTIEWANGADLAPEFLYDLAMQQDQGGAVKKV
ncbi:MAG: DUF2442 domain-containing protein [Cyclobacteriaceae bacterium]